MISGTLVLCLCGVGVAAVGGDKDSDSVRPLSSVTVAQALSLSPSQMSLAAVHHRTSTLLASSEFTTTAPHTVEIEIPQGAARKHAQITYLRLSDGFRMATQTENDYCPGLSLVKLFIADYVLEHGDVASEKKIKPMIEKSSDVLATELFGKYPNSITATAKKYGLTHTQSATRWGKSMTSTSDVVKFLTQLKQKDPDSPILEAMESVSPIAEDGTAQNYGTFVLPEVKGTKFGWSDDKDMHSSVSFGDDFIVAAYIAGTARDLSTLVRKTLGNFPVDGILPQAKNVSTIPTPKVQTPKVLIPGRGSKDVVQDPAETLSPEVKEAFRDYFRTNKDLPLPK